MKPTTWLLWTGPYVLLIAGLVGLVCLVHNRRSLAMTLSPEQQRQAAVLLSGGRE
jgi:cytochrome c-type biogenesis protein CcmH